MKWAHMAYTLRRPGHTLDANSLIAALRQTIVLCVGVLRVSVGGVVVCLHLLFAHIFCLYLCLIV